MSDTKTPPMNPNAFPSAHNGGAYGMTLRDYFAAAALTGILANPNTPDGVRINGEDVSAMKAAYVVADAMLAAREAK